MFIVKVTDELGFTYGYEVPASEVASVVSEWMESVCETPIASIEIEPKD
jgi:hypothetical protein